MSWIPWLSSVFTCIRQNIKLSLSHALLYSFIVFLVCDFNPKKRKYILARIGLYFWGFGEKLVYFRDLVTQAKYFYGAVEFFSGSWEDQRIIFRDQGSTDHHPPPPWGPRLFERVIINFQALTDRANHWGNWLKDNSFLMYDLCPIGRRVPSRTHVLWYISCFF